MKLSVEQLTKQLETALGGDAVTVAATAYAIDGKQPEIVCHPQSAEQIAAALRLCIEAEAAVIPRGSGTAMAIGNVPRQVDVIIETAKLKRVIEHDHANLTTTMESGITMGDLQTALEPQKQFVPLDAPVPDRATVGGIVAANLNGPRRSYYGSVRDLVIGMRVVLASGEQIKAGGKVVKNVAGYDMCKLFVGSFGTLGIITEVTLRTVPIAESAATVIASGTINQADRFRQELSRSPLLPAAIFLLNDGATWQGLRDFSLQSDRLIYRVTLPRGKVLEFVELVRNWAGVILNSDIAAGTVWLALPARRSGLEKFVELIELARQQHGHAVVFVAPGELKQGVEVWGPSPATISLQREIKRQFDPKGLLNPGRFLAGI